MNINNCEEKPAIVRANIDRTAKNDFISAIKGKGNGKTVQEVLEQCVLKCISDPDNFLDYIFSE